MRTLFIEYSYLKGNGGGIYAARAHINLFARLSSYMTLIYPSNKDGDIEGVNISEINEIRPIKDTRNLSKKIYDRLLGWFTRYSLLNDALLDPNKYDVVVFDNSVVSAHLIDTAKTRGLKVITIHHNYQVEYFKADGNPYTKIPDIFWTKVHEKKAVEFSDLGIVLTPQDADLLSKHYCQYARFCVLGVCEYEGKSIEITGEKSRQHRYLITGGLSSRQNEKSIIRWINHFYPILLKTDPCATLTIAGRMPSIKLKSFIESHNINLIDSPVDMIPILKESDYYICPVDCGGGLKLKIMDGLKAGLPVISHRISARGYEPMAEAGVLFDYEDEQSFATAISEALNCPIDKVDIIKLYNSVFSFECGLNRLNAILKKSSIL